MHPGNRPFGEDQSNRILGSGACSGSVELSLSSGIGFSSHWRLNVYMLCCLLCEVCVLHPSVHTVQMWVLESLEIKSYLLTLPSTQFSWILEGMYSIGTAEGTLRAVVKWPRLLKSRDCSCLKSHSDGTTHLGENCRVVTILCMCVLPGGRI